jgi:hypothetical protein
MEKSEYKSISKKSQEESKQMNFKNIWVNVGVQKSMKF